MAFGAAGALGGLLGPPLKEYEGETYEWSYSCCGSSCKGEGELVAVDSQTLAWRDVKGSFVPASAKLDASRDAANVHHFVTDDGSGVWVFGKPGKPLKFYSSSEAATSGGAPTVTAMIRTATQNPRPKARLIISSRRCCLWNTGSGARWRHEYNSRPKDWASGG